MIRWNPFLAVLFTVATMAACDSSPTNSTTPVDSKVSFALNMGEFSVVGPAQFFQGATLADIALDRFQYVERGFPASNIAVNARSAGEQFIQIEPAFSYGVYASASGRSKIDYAITHSRSRSAPVLWEQPVLQLDVFAGEEATYWDDVLGREVTELVPIPDQLLSSGMKELKPGSDNSYGMSYTLPSSPTGKHVVYAYLVTRMMPTDNEFGTEYANQLSSFTVTDAKFDGYVNDGTSALVEFGKPLPVRNIAPSPNLLEGDQDPLTQLRNSMDRERFAATN